MKSKATSTSDDQRASAAVGRGSKSALAELIRREKGKPPPAKVHVVHRCKGTAAGAQPSGEKASAPGKQQGGRPV